LRLWKTGAADETTLSGGRASALELDESGAVQKSVWSGQFNVDGLYCVCVRQTGAQPANYALQATVK
jgi:hypothetical protein